MQEQEALLAQSTGGDAAAETPDAATASRDAATADTQPDVVGALGPSDSNEGGDSNNTSIYIIVFVTLAIACLLLAAVVIAVMVMRKRRRQRHAAAAAQHFQQNLKFGSGVTGDPHDVRARSTPACTFPSHFPLYAPRKTVAEIQTCYIWPVHAATSFMY